MKSNLFIALLTIIIASCSNLIDVDSEKTNDSKIQLKNHSYANVDSINTKHLHLDLKIDFSIKKINGIARHEMQNKGTNKAIFDVKGLKINKVTTGSSDNEKNTKFTLGSTDQNGVLGQPLIVAIDKNTAYVNIYYETTEESEALDWLDSALTSSKNKPFLYTQGQAVLTRTWIPIQDLPSNRITYSADVHVPNDLMAVMSASNPIKMNSSGDYHFEMINPIPCYLIALAVGELAYHDLGNKTGIYCEPELLEESIYEFQELPEMMRAAEELYGSYDWGKYDILILPYSFPFGGMENPKLTFVNPTIISGDRSLVSVIAHELAHSWSGNLVTNESWNDFWLNEGFTVYFENRIMEEIIGKRGADNLALIEFFELKEDIERIEHSEYPEDSHLFLDLEGRNPDEGMTDVAYVKGAFFLKTLEQVAGRERMDGFLASYFKHFKFTSVGTEDFIAYLNKELLTKYDIQFNINEWIYQPGIPENCISLRSLGFDRVKMMAKSFAEGKDIFTNSKFPKSSIIDGQIHEQWVNGPLKKENYSVQEWLTFIRHLPADIGADQLRILDQRIGFTKWTNAEIQFEWYKTAIKNNYEEVYPELEKFLEKIGRRKFILPLYETLYANRDTKQLALDWFSKFKVNYHAVSSNSIQKALMK